MPRFLSIKDASSYSGLSTFYIRNGLKEGTIPYQMSGKKYFIDMEKWMIILNEASCKAI